MSMIWLDLSCNHKVRVRKCNASDARKFAAQAAEADGDTEAFVDEESVDQDELARDTEG